MRELATFRYGNDDKSWNEAWSRAESLEKALADAGVARESIRVAFKSGLPHGLRVRVPFSHLKRAREILRSLVPGNV